MSGGGGGANPAAENPTNSAASDLLWFVMALTVQARMRSTPDANQAQIGARRLVCSCRDCRRFARSAWARRPPRRRWPFAQIDRQFPQEPASDSAARPLTEKASMCRTTRCWKRAAKPMANPTANGRNDMHRPQQRTSPVAAVGRMTRVRAFALAAGLSLSGVQAMAADGLTTLSSSGGPKETMDRLEAAVKQKGLTVVARIDHAAGAAAVGLSLRPTEVLIFGNAKGGTPLMQSTQTIGIDLPLKALVWQDASGRTWLSYDPAWLAKRHGLGPE